MGPNKVLFGGLLQPALDGVKLLLKELVLISKRDKFIFLGSPLLVCVVILFVWVLLDWSGRISLKLGLLLLFCCLGGVIYTRLFGG